MNDDIARQFDLTPPGKGELRVLVADLSEDERQVLLEHGTEAAFCCIFFDEKREGVYTCRLCGLPSIQGRRKVHWLAELHRSLFRKPPPIHSRQQLRYDPHGNRLHSLRCTPGACLSGWPPAHRRAILHQFHLARVHAEGRAAPDKLDRGAPEGQAWTEIRYLGEARSQ